MRASTHQDLARLMYPGMSPGIINTVNHAMDSPRSGPGYGGYPIQLDHIMRKPKYGFINNYLTQPIAARSAPHREYGHSYIDGLMLAAQYGPMAMQAFMAHIASDMMRDVWVRTHGFRGADMMESTWAYNFHKSRRRPRSYYRDPIYPY